MVHLHSVRLRGFKTFARPTELIFEPGVTVIIGPNGSGKSNIADAVLWVLGEQSPANLRGRTMQDVIFSGPDGRKSSAVAEVSLVFDDECGSLPLGCSQVEVTRRLLRDAGSEYRLNGTGCRLLDVQDIVGGLGLGREMHSVISQGKVEALLNSTPDARRALVEEAAGLGRFKKRRERARAKLERTRQNLLRVSDVEREVKHALRPLRQQVAAAERFAQATEEWALARARVVLLDLLEGQRACQATEGSVARLQAQRAEVEGRLAVLRGQRAGEEQHFTAAMREREELAASYHRTRAEADRLEARAVLLRQRVVRIEGELDRARRRSELSSSESASLSNRLREVSTATADENRLHRVDEATHALRKALEEALPAHREAVGREDDLKDTVFEIETARTRAHHDRDFLRREAGERERVQGELTHLAEAASARLAELEAKALDLERQREACDDLVGSAGRESEIAADRRDGAREQAELTAREELHLAELVSGAESRQAVLQDLLRRREGTPAGAKELVATVGGARLLTEAFTVESGYERAFTAALGPLAQAVVLPGEPDVALALRADGIVEALWETPTSSRESGGELGAAQLPPGTRDLWEVVSGPERLIETLRSLIPPTAVVEDTKVLEAVATSMGTKPWCLVSRSGELVRGKQHAARRSEAGAEALLRARNELGAVEEECDSLVQKRSVAAQAVEQAAATARRAEADSRQAEEVLREAERRALTGKNEADLQARRVEEVRAQMAELQSRLEREKDLEARTMADLAQVETVIAGREAELEEARSSFRTEQAKLESSRRTVALLEDKKGQAALLEVRLRARCRAHEIERERVQAQCATAALEAVRCERRVALLGRYLPVLASLLETVEPLAERVRSAVRGAEPRVEQARARSEEAAKVIRDWGGAEAELQRELDDIHVGLTDSQVDLARLEDRRSVLDEELAGLRNRHMSPRTLTPADLSGHSKEVLTATAERADRRRQSIGPVNPLAEQESAELEERARFLSEQRRDLEASLAQLQDVIGELEEHINTTFSEIFEATNRNFAGVIATVFPGAKGLLRLTEGKIPPRTPGDLAVDDDASLDGPADDSEEGELGRGIVLEVKLPNKAPRSMSLLSGGEKAMTAIAFLFSLFLARPCPFYILDEVEASLDDLNIRRFLSLIRKYRDKTQFIIITHQRQTMEVADTLYGVALESDGTSRVLSRRLNEKRGERRNDIGPAAGDLMAKEA